MSKLKSVRSEFVQEIKLRLRAIRKRQVGWSKLVRGLLVAMVYSAEASYPYWYIEEYQVRSRPLSSCPIIRFHMNPIVAHADIEVTE